MRNDSSPHLMREERQFFQIQPHSGGSFSTAARSELSTATVLGARSATFEIQTESTSCNRGEPGIEQLCQYDW